MTIPAQVVDVGAKMGIKGVSRVRCKILDGRDRDKVVMRNVVGPIKVGDVITRNLAKNGESVRGIIIVNECDEWLDYAVSVNDNILLKYYEP